MQDFSFTNEARGEELTALFAEPVGGLMPAPAVLLLPAIAGVNRYVMRVAERLASRGYAVVVLDYFFREGQAPDVSTPERIGAAVRALPDPRVLSDIDAAVAQLRRDPRVAPERIATLGFCIGGMYAYLAACELDGLSASVNYYGTVRYGEISRDKPASPLERVGELKAPLLCHFGTADRLISSADVDAFEESLRSSQKTFEICTYRGAPHAFDEDFRPAFRPVAAAEAWRRTLTFLDWYVGGFGRP
ncbi:MAG: dienelactone hydrolase family protein [Kiloniellales bacterium]